MLLGLPVRIAMFLRSVRDGVIREDGAVAAEYGLLLFLIAVAIVLVVTAFGVTLVSVYERANSSIP